MAERFQSVWMALLLVSITMMLLQPQQGQAQSFEEVVKWKCNKFVKTNPGRCDTFWKTFSGAFVKKDPETVTQDDYNEMLKAEPIQIDKDKVLLYSATGHLLPKNPDTYVDVWQTIYGILADTPLWCGKKNSDEVLLGDEDCKSDKPVKMYWAAVSVALAKAASGTVTVLLAGDKGYKSEPDSFLAKYELPNFDHKVTGFHVLMVNMKSGVNEDTCGHKSLVELQKDITSVLPSIPPHECKYIQEETLEKLPPAEWWKKATESVKMAEKRKADSPSSPGAPKRQAKAKRRELGTERHGQSDRGTESQ